MINYQLPHAPSLAISGKGMNYLEKHPKVEPTVKKKNFKGYLTISGGFPRQTGMQEVLLGRGSLPVLGAPSGSGEQQAQGLSRWLPCGPAPGLRAIPAT